MSQEEGMGGRSVFCQTSDSHNDACADYCLLECDVVPIWQVYAYLTMHLPGYMASYSKESNLQS